MTAPIRSMAELLMALRTRRDELQITHETIDGIAGWPTGYAGKLLAPDPIKNLGWMSLGAALDTLAIQLVVVENTEQRKLVERRWKPRARPQREGLGLFAALTPEQKEQALSYREDENHGDMAPASIAASIDNEVPATLQITPELQRKLVDLQHMKRIAKLGAKQRNRVMKKRARQRAAAHAARARWSKRDVANA